MKRSILVAPLLFLLLWVLITSFSLVNPLFLPSPLRVALVLVQSFTSGEFFQDIGMTLVRLAAGFVLGMVLGIPLGLFMGYYQKVYDYLDFLVDFFRSIPVASLFPLFLVVFGIGELSKISTTAWSTSLVILINTMYGVRNGKKLRIMVAKTMKASEYQIFVKAIVPEALPEIFTGLRTAISIGLIVVVLTEMLMGTKTGLGQRIFNASLMYQVPEMYAAIFLTGLLGFSLNKVFVVIGNRVIHWAGK